MVKIFLKKIRLKGFKSFANKTDIEIEENITAVVGPNGSGKSNIVDAIRWVLGEQSAKNLRGSRMSDIIFAGSEELNAKRKAGVTLFFDNSNGELPVEGKELTLGREVNSDGRSDYLINGASCRLKDIERLLMDSGLGSDGYSIVGQGKIDSIIKSKPDKLRIFFEEAAGIMKHKSRKEEAEKRLENTNNDLNRIDDLVDELEKRHDPLKKAAEKAKKYLNYKGELADLEISLLNKQWQDNSDKFELLTDKKETVEAELNNKENKYQKLSQKLEKEKEQEKKYKREKDELNDKYFQNQNKLNEINNNLNVMEERKNNYIEKKEDLNKKLKELESKKESGSAELKAAEENFKLINSDQKNLNNKIESLKGKIQKNKNKVSNLKEKIEKKRKIIADNKEKIQKENSALQRLKERVEISSDRLEEISDDKNKVDKKIEAAFKNKKEIENKIKELSQSIKDKNEKVKKLKEEIKDDENNLEAGKDKLVTLKENYQHYSSRLELMEEMQDSYEGYYNGVRSILEKRDQFGGLIDVVAESIEVEAEYEKALETALGAKMQNIIVEDDQTAKDAVRYLKENNSGRATFLPLNMVNGSRLADRYLNKLSNYPGFVGLAVDLVDFPAKLKNVFNYLLGQIVVSKDLDSAVEISKNIKRNFRIVTVEGDVVYPGGAISGGSTSSNSRDLIGRSRKIEELKKKKQKFQQQGKDLVKKLENDKERLDKKHESLEELNSSLQSLKMEENNLENKKESLENDIKELKKEKKLRQNNFSELDNNLEDNKNSIADHQQKIKKLETENKKLNKEISEIDSEISAAEEKINKLDPELKELELDGARISEKRNSAKEKLESKKSALKKIKNQISESKDKIDDIKKNLKKIADRRVKLHEKKNELQNEAEELKTKKQEITEKLKKLEANIEIKEKKSKTLQQELNTIRDRFHKLDLKYTKLEDKLDNIKEILQNDYELKPEEINQEELMEIKAEDEDRVEEKIKNLKKEMDKLHPVNEAAVEEFEELKERLDYLHEQQEDLQHARKSIELVISDIEESMKKMFSETFYEIKEEFSKVFKALFQGGKAELKLTDPEEMLTTGVEIHAQPPGKSLKSLSLLSGGERALTAIALIFSFIQVKPSPFYVLDEIDAPLDDVNIVRFADFIKRYSEVAQFIIITHRRYMMTEVDSLYGVTMEKSGVSRLVSLKLDQAEEFNDNYIKEAL